MKLYATLKEEDEALRLDAIDLAKEYFTKNTLEADYRGEQIGHPLQMATLIGDGRCAINMEKTTFVNRESGFEGVTAPLVSMIFKDVKLDFAFFAKTKMAGNCKKWQKMVSNSNRLFSHCFRKTKKSAT